MVRTALLVALCAIVSIAQTRQVQVTVQTPAQASELMALAQDAEIEGSGATVLVHSDEELAELVLAGFNPVVEIADLEAFYRSRLTAPTRTSSVAAAGIGQGSIGGYFTYGEMYSFLDGLAAQHPNIMAPAVSLGLTAEGRDIWMWKISDNPLVEEREPEVLVDGMHHAREPMSMEVVCYFAQQLCQAYGSDPQISALVNERQIYLVPMINADGYVYNTTVAPLGGGTWRKNRRLLPDSNIGVDLNRNYGQYFAYDDVGSSPVTSSFSYRGPAAFSEPETQVMKAFAESRDLAAGISLHTFGNYLLIPPSHALNTYPPGPWRSRYETYAARMAPMAGGLLAGYSWQVLYLSNGTSIDWQAQSLYGGNRMLAFSCELGTNLDGFWPSTSRIVPICQSAMELLTYVTSIAGPSLRMTGADVTDSGGSAPNVWEAGETLSVVTQVANEGSLPADVTLHLEPTCSAVHVVGTSGAGLGILFPFGGTGGNSILPLQLLISPNTRPGTLVTFDLVAEAPGAAPVRIPLSGVVGDPSAFMLTDDCESDAGWIVGAPGDTATGGVWTRGDPNGTVYNGALFNPEDDHTPGSGTQCWFTGQGPVGGAVGLQDVDGTTSLTSPRFDLSHTMAPVISYWRWFATTGTDSLTAELSNDDGTTWVTLETTTDHQPTWLLRVFRVDDFLPRTSAMRLRFRAADQPNNSFCEAAIDELRIDASPAMIDLAVSTPVAIGTSTAITVLASVPSLYYVVGASFTAHQGFTISNVPIPLDDDALLHLVGDVPEVFGGFIGQLDGQGMATANLVLPSEPLLSGLTFNLAAVLLDPNATVLAASGATRIVVP